MGYWEFLTRCVRVTCAKLFSCIHQSLYDVKALVLRGRRGAAELKGGDENEDEENLGLLSEPDLGLEGGVLRTDADLRKRAQDLVEERAAKEFAKQKKHRSPKQQTPAPRSRLAATNSGLDDEEEAWLDSFAATSGANLEVNVPDDDDAEIDFLS